MEGKVVGSVDGKVKGKLGGKICRKFEGKIARKVEQEGRKRCCRGPSHPYLGGSLVGQQGDFTSFTTRRMTEDRGECELSYGKPLGHVLVSR